MVFVHAARKRPEKVRFDAGDMDCSRVAFKANMPESLENVTG
jgi:hypothetical protein